MALSIFRIGEGGMNLAVLFATALVGISCGGRQSGESNRILRLATTTSLENSGLLALLLPPFERSFDIRIQVIAAGTGKALKLAEAGDVDLVIVHDPALEEKFVKEGFGVSRAAVCWNYFVIAGPPSDPAGVRDAVDAKEAFLRILEKSAPFVSRGDESGTHQKEKYLWKETGKVPQGKWYLESGQGMGETILLADEKGAYVLTDRATFIAIRAKTSLAILFEGDVSLRNMYSVIAVNPKRYTHVNYRGAMTFIRWLTSPEEGQKIIGAYRLNGEVLFHPAAIKKEPPDSKRPAKSSSQ